MYGIYQDGRVPTKIRRIYADPERTSSTAIGDALRAGATLHTDHEYVPVHPTPPRMTAHAGCSIEAADWCGPPLLMARSKVPEAPQTIGERIGLLCLPRRSIRCWAGGATGFTA
jgi:hypothetical protein